MAQITPMLARLGYDPYANPPNYGNPDPIVVNNTHRVSGDTLKGWARGAVWRLQPLERTFSFFSLLILKQLVCFCLMDMVNHMTACILHYRLGCKEAQHQLVTCLSHSIVS